MLGDSLGRALGEADTIGFLEGEELGALDNEGIPEGPEDDTLG